MQVSTPVRVSCDLSDCVSDLPVLLMFLEHPPFGGYFSLNTVQPIVKENLL